MKPGSVPFEACELMKSSDNNLYFRYAKQYLESKLPNIIQKCPYKIVKI